MGLAFVLNNEIVDTKYYLIQPPLLEFDISNIEIHGITAKMVKDAPTFDEVWEEIEKKVNNNILVAHNARFDMSVLKCCLEFYHLPIPNIKYICSIPISSKVCKKVGTSLIERAGFLGIEYNNAHNSLEDAKVCATLVIETLKLDNQRLKTQPRNFEKFCKAYSNINIYDLDSLEPQRTFAKRSKYAGKRIAISEIAATTESIDILSPFYNKTFVFTGDLKGIPRKVAMQKVVDKGGLLKSTVNKDLNFLVLGIQDLKLVGEDGMSSKERKAKELISKGASIKILCEDEFLAML